MNRLSTLTLTLGGLGALGVLGTASGCNPLASGNLIDGAHVKHFELRPPISGKAYSRLGLRYPGGGGRDGHLLLAGEGVPVLSWIRFSPIGAVVDEYASLEATQSIMAPLSDLDSTTFGGVAAVPSPTPNDDKEHAVVGVVSSSEPDNSHVTRVNLTDMSRTDSPDDDIRAPFIEGNPAINFGKGIAAINLEPGATDANFEVAVGSDIGVFVFDSVGATRDQYIAARDMELMNNPLVFDGDAVSEGYTFTYCDNLTGFHALAAGDFGPGGVPAFVASTEGGLVLITDPGLENLVGAPIYDCMGAQIDNAGSPSSTFGNWMLVDDMDGDGRDDLFVGDPTNNRVDVYLGSADGIPDTPDILLTPPEAAEGYGFSIGRADLKGGFGSAIIISAPDSAVDGEAAVGKSFVYPIDEDNRVLDDPITLVDQQPRDQSLHGRWVGGIYNAENDRDEIVLIGSIEGRIHLAVDPQDPRP